VEIDDGNVTPLALEIRNLFAADAGVALGGTAARGVDASEWTPDANDWLCGVPATIPVALMLRLKGGGCAGVVEEPRPPFDLNCVVGLIGVVVSEWDCLVGDRIGRRLLCSVV
jgi:hypothetical protein